MSPSLTSIASSIPEKAILLSELLDKQKISQPSALESGYNAYAGETTAIRQARNDLATAAQDLMRLAQGPEDQILETAWLATDVSNLAVLVRFKLPQSVPLESSINIAELVAKTGLQEDIVLRMMRYAIGNGVFVENPEGVFAHSAVSARLARSDALCDIVQTSTHELTKIVTSLSDTLETQKNAKKGEGPTIAFNLAFPGHDNVFSLAQKDPIIAKHYHMYQIGRSKTDRWSAANIIRSWDWASVGSKTIVDVGGSMGQTCFAIQEACPNATFIVQDLNPAVLEKGRQTAATMPELADRITFVQHDFFNPQNVTADIYLLRHIFHDWSDADIIQIARNMVPALKNGSRLLIIEGVMPPPPGKKTGTVDEKLILVEDMFMMTVHGTKERTTDRYIELFKEADPNFEFVGISGGTDGAFQSILDFVFQV